MTTPSSGDLVTPSSARRVRFPAPYRSSTRGTTVLNPQRTATGSGSLARGQRTLDVPSRGRTGAAPAGGGKNKVRYQGGPLRRLDPDNIVTRRVDSAAGRNERNNQTGPGKTTRPDGPLSNAGPRQVDGRSPGVAPGSRGGNDPNPRGQVLGDTPNAPRSALRGGGVGASSGVGGGVQPSGYRGGGGHGGYHQPHHPQSHFYYSWHWGGHWSYHPYYWWFWPCHWLGYWPYYYHHYRPFFSAIFYPAATSVVYVQEAEPVGEAIVQAEPQPRQEERLPIAAERYLTLGDRAFREGRYTDAVQFYAKAVEFAPDQGALFLVLSDALFAAGDYHYGAYAIRRALELDPSLAEATVDKRLFYADPLQFEHQVKVLEEYLADHPTDRDARLVLALNYHFGGRSDDARRLLGSAEGLADDFAALTILQAAR